MFNLSDASPESALAYVQKRLVNNHLKNEELKPCLDMLGGRLYDLEMLIQKIHAGRHPQGNIIS